MASADGKSRILDLGTLVPIGVLVAVAGGLLGGAVWLNTKFLELDFRLQSIEEKVANPWNIERMAAWRDVLEVSNPGLKVPPVRRE